MIVRPTPTRLLLICCVLLSCSRAPEGSIVRQDIGALTRAADGARGLLRTVLGRGAPPETPPGPPAPPLRGVTADGVELDLGQWRGSAVVVVFYRGHACGLCQLRLERLNQSLSAYQREGARVLGVTSDSPEDVRRTVHELGLGFPVVAVSRATLEAWEVWPSHEAAPRPASAVVDERGFLVLKHVGENAGDRAPDVELLAKLRLMARPPAASLH